MNFQEKQQLITLLDKAVQESKNMVERDMYYNTLKSAKSIKTDEEKLARINQLLSE